MASISKNIKYIQTMIIGERVYAYVLGNYEVIMNFHKHTNSPKTKSIEHRHVAGVWLNLRIGELHWICKIHSVLTVAMNDNIPPG